MNEDTRHAEFLLRQVYGRLSEFTAESGIGAFSESRVEFDGSGKDAQRLLFSAFTNLVDLLSMYVYADGCGDCEPDCVWLNTETNLCDRRAGE